MITKNKIILISLSFFVFFTIIFSSSKDEYYSSRNKLISTYDLIFQNYTDEIDATNLTIKTIEELTKQLDPFTNYLKKQNKLVLSTMAKGNYGGVGFRISMQNDTLIVISLMENEPAWQSGIYPGDKIIQIDNKSIANIPFDNISSMIRGKPNTEVILTILRQNKEIDFPIIRKNIKIKEIPYSEMITKDVGYVKLDGFSKNAHNQLREKLISFNENGLKYLIFDLRDNSGGLLNEAKDILNMLIEKNKLLVYTRGKQNYFNKKYYSRNTPLISKNIRIAVLINNKSASASEIVSGAIQDLDRGIILGTTSFGKGLVQNLYDLDDTSSVKISTSKYYLPSGRWIQKLDYYDNNEIISYEIDSTKKYITNNNRIVKANTGIIPDSTITTKKLSDITQDLLNKKLIFEFSRTYLLEHPKENNFENTNEYFLKFVKYLDKKNYVYKNPTIIKLEEIENNLEKNNNLTEKNKTLFLTLKNSFISNSKSLLIENKKEISDLLSIELAGFYGGKKAKYQVRIKKDKIIQTAISLLKSDYYNQILNIK